MMKISIKLLRFFCLLSFILLHVNKAVLRDSTFIAMDRMVAAKELLTPPLGPRLELWVDVGDAVSSPS